MAMKEIQMLKVTFSRDLSNVPWKYPYHSNVICQQRHVMTSLSIPSLRLRDGVGVCILVGISVQQY